MKRFKLAIAYLLICIVIIITICCFAVFTVKPNKQIVLIHIAGDDRISIVTTTCAYDYLTRKEFKELFGIEIKQ